MLRLPTSRRRGTEPLGGHQALIPDGLARRSPVAPVLLMATSHVVPSAAAAWPSSPCRRGRTQPGRAADRPGPGPAAAVVRAGLTVLAPGPPGHLVRPRAGRTGRTVRATAARRARRRPPALRPGRRRRGDLAHRAAAARPPARRQALPADHGDPTTRKPWSRATLAGSSRGCPRTAEPADRYGGSPRVWSWVSG
jgi:hypothetical protein